MVTASWSEFIHAMNSAASFGCFDWVVTELAEPPQLPVASSPSDHCGMGAIFHLPAVSGALPCSTPGAQIAETQPACVPSLSAAFHSGVYIGLLSMTPFSTRSPQYCATLFVASLSMSTDHVSPSMPHHEAPACCVRPVNQPAS